MSVAGVPVDDLAAEYGTPVYIVDEDDFRARAASFRDAFAGCDVFYAAKAFLCTATARWMAEDGLCLDVCTGGELATALRDRKSTRLNSSHVAISYAVFCLKKKMPDA